MIRKEFVNEDGHSLVRVTFTIPSGIWADKIYLVGDFNDWHRSSHPFQRNRNGNWVIGVELEVGRAYQFRYLFDDESWTNDDQADAYVHNPYGSDNFLVITDPQFKRYYE